MTFAPPRALKASILGAVALLSCSTGERGDEPTVTAAPPLLSVIVTPAHATLRLDETLRFVATLGPASRQSGSWLWTSSDSTRVRVDDSGLVRAVGAPTPGIAICAALSTDAGAKGCATVVIPAR